jgi:hypothetical protein
MVFSYSCKFCKDFDLCVKCTRAKGHEHPMEARGLDVHDETSSAAAAFAASVSPCSSNSWLENATDDEKGRKESANAMTRRVSHAAMCTDVDCKRPYCHKFKVLIYHSKVK